jgi:hypothetical protein
LGFESLPRSLRKAPLRRGFLLPDLTGADRVEAVCPIHAAHESVDLLSGVALALHDLRLDLERERAVGVAHLRHDVPGEAPASYSRDAKVRRSEWFVTPSIELLPTLTSSTFAW